MRSGYGTAALPNNTVGEACGGVLEGCKGVRMVGCGYRDVCQYVCVCVAHLDQPRLHPDRPRRSDPPARSTWFPSAGDRRKEVPRVDFDKGMCLVWAYNHRV